MLTERCREHFNCLRWKDRFRKEASFLQVECMYGSICLSKLLGICENLQCRIFWKLLFKYRFSFKWFYVFRPLDNKDRNKIWYFLKSKSIIIQNILSLSKTMLIKYKFNVFIFIANLTMFWLFLSSAFIRCLLIWVTFRILPSRFFHKLY